MDVYPNPSNGAITVSMNFNKATDVQVSVFNALGQIVYSAIQSVSGDFKMPIILNEKGMYFVTIVDLNSNLNITKKIVVQ